MLSGIGINHPKQDDVPNPLMIQNQDNNSNKYADLSLQYAIINDGIAPVQGSHF